MKIDNTSITHRYLYLIITKRNVSNYKICHIHSIQQAHHFFNPSYDFLIIIILKLS